MLKSTENRLKLLLFALAFVVYANTLGHDYAWDDKIVILENPNVKKGFMGIPALFIKSHSDYIADKYGYRPVTLTSFAIEYGLFKNAPGVGHFTNVVLFALLCMVIFSVLRKIFFSFSNLGPFLIAALFAVHPIHVEAVANIKSRDEIMALLFSMLSLSQLINYYNAKKMVSLAYALLLFVLAFLSKENAVTFLFVMPLTLLYLGVQVNLKQLVKPALFILAALLVSIVILKLSSSGTTGASLSEGAGIYYEGGILGNSFFYSYQPLEKIANALTILLLYLKNFLYPATLLYFYGYNQIPVAHIGQPLVIVSLIIHLGLLLFAVLRFRSQREISYGILFYFFTIIIYTHIFRTLADTMADRFLFTPSLGLCIALVFTLAKLCRANLRTISLEHLFAGNNRQAKGLSYLLIVIMLLMGGRTLSRNAVWKNNLTLVSHDMPYLENCARAHNYYADLLKTQLITSFNSGTEASMIHHYQRSIEISRESYYAYLGLGTYYCDAGRYNEGIVVLDSMLVHFPKQADPNFYIGQAFFSVENYPAALSHLEASLRLAPNVLSTYYTLSITYARSGQFDKALATIEEARKRFSESSQIYDALGNIYFEKGDMEQSTRSTLEMLRLGADPQKVYGVIIGRYQIRKQDKAAAFYYQQAIKRGVFRPGGQ